MSDDKEREVDMIHLAMTVLAETLTGKRFELLTPEDQLEVGRQLAEWFLKLDQKIRASNTCGQCGRAYLLPAAWRDPE